jgi:branched-chain amino acid transport system substrate-binding protein
MIDTARTTRRAVTLTVLGLLGAAVAGCAATGGGTTASTTPSAAIVPTEQQSVALAPQSASASVKVAMLLPLSRPGEAQRVANDLKQAGELALFELNRPGLTIIAKDTGTTPEMAAAAAEAAIAEGAEIIVGPVFANDVLAVAPIARQANVPVVAFSTDRKVAGNGVYLLSFLVDDEIDRVVAQAANNGRRTIAAYVPQTPYGDLVDGALRRSAARSGMQVAVTERYVVDPNAMAEPMKRLKAAFEAAEQAGQPIDTLLLPGAQDTLPTIAPMLAYYDVPVKGVQLLGTAGWDYASIGREPVLARGLFAAPDQAGWRDFAGRYQKTYGTVPVRIASLGYDAVSLALALAGNPPGQRYTPGNLTRASGFAGTDGLFRLRADGTSERGLAIYEVQKMGPQVIAPAPNAFTVAQN